MLRGRLVIVGLGIVMLIGAAPAAAATIAVNTTNDDQAQGDGNCSLRGKCVRTKRSGAFTHVDKKGRNRFRWNGRVGRTTLARGNYLLRSTPQAPRVGPTVTASFTIT